MPNNVCFVDTETTGLDPDRHDIWEVGLITPDGEERRWFLDVDESAADLIALNIGGYFERHPRHGPGQGGEGHRNPANFDLGPNGDGLVRPHTFCAQFQRLTRGLHLAGAVVSFDADRLYRLMMRNGYIPAWHYHLIDVEALAAGFLAGRGGEWTADSWTPPWDSSALSAAVGVDPADFDRHTALGDARWAKAIYEAVMDG